GSSHRREHRSEVPPAPPPLRRSRRPPCVASDRQAERSVAAGDGTARCDQGGGVARRPDLARRPCPHQRRVRDHARRLASGPCAHWWPTVVVISYSELTSLVV